VPVVSAFGSGFAYVCAAYCPATGGRDRGIGNVAQSCVVPAPPGRALDAGENATSEILRNNFAARCDTEAVSAIFPPVTGEATADSLPTAASSTDSGAATVLQLPAFEAILQAVLPHPVAALSSPHGSSV